MNSLGAFVVESDAEEFLEIWNGWIKSGISVPEHYIPTLVAMLYGLLEIDKDILGIVVACTR